MPTSTRYSATVTLPIVLSSQETLSYPQHSHYPQHAPQSKNETTDELPSFNRQECQNTLTHHQDLRKHLFSSSSSSRCDPSRNSLCTFNWRYSSATTGHQDLSNSCVDNASKRNGLVMHIRTQTWASDSHELFDYESRNLLLSEFKCACMQDTYHISRIGGEVHFLPSHEAKTLYACEPHAKVLARIVWANDGHYYLVPPSSHTGCFSETGEVQEPEENCEDQKLWLAVRHLRDRSVVVSSGDTLKLGRFQLKIKETVMSTQDTKENKFSYFPYDNDDCETVAPDPGENNNHESADYNDEREKVDTTVEDKRKDAEKVTEPTCRICLCDTNDLENLSFSFNPLVSPCACKGSMEWVHLQCLRTWISGRLDIRHDSSSFFWKSLQCELCKATYPTFVRISKGLNLITSSPLGRTESNKAHAGIQKFQLDTTQKEDQIIGSLSKLTTYSVELYEFPRPEAPYVILEPSTNHNDKGFYIVGLANNRIARVGRGHESDVRLADISVSRLHSVLRYQSFPSLKKYMNVLVSSSGFGTPDIHNNSGCFIVEDHHSKFGTLLELQQPFRLDTTFPSVTVQAGRTIITITLKRRWRIKMPACMLQRQHAASSDIYVIIRQPQQIVRSNLLLESQRRACFD